MDLDPNQKLAGILAPLFAIRGSDDLGIGDTETLKELVGWSAKHGLGLVQILPVNETGNDSSPYNLISAMAIEPSTIATTPAALPDLPKKNFTEITAQHDLAALKTGPVQYQKVKALKRELLLAAFANFQSLKADQSRVRAYRVFEKDNAHWLEDYSLYRALMTWNGTELLNAWPETHKSPAAARDWMAALDSSSQAKLVESKNFHAYVQWIAHEQWLSVRTYAESVGVALVGDLPVGVSIHSCDVWSQPDLFNLSRSSGAPPEKVFKSDPFTEQWGQNWGFPLYHWENMSKDNYTWWRNRFRSLMNIFHLMRVDHALGFFRIYSFPWRPERNAEFTGLSAEEAVKITKGPLPCFVERDDSTEEGREFNRLHGDTIFKVFLEEVPRHCLLAEDLGEVAPYVRPTLEKLEIPGFKIPQWERQGDRFEPGVEYQRLSLATFGTHDHPPIKTFWTDLYAQSQAEDETIRAAAIHTMWEFMDFCGHPDTKLPQPFNEEIHANFLRGLFLSNSWLAVHMITDLFGTDERFNVPGLAGDLNWTERFSQPIALWNEKWPQVTEILEKSLNTTSRTVK